MATVRCPCGRRYNIPDTRVGQRVKCGACGELFTAEAVGAPPSGSRTAARPTSSGRRARAAAKAKPKGAPRRKHHLGELAIERGYVTREQLEACLEYQRALDKLPHHEEHRLGGILVRMSLITRAQLESLLGEQTDEMADEIAQAAASIPKALERKHAVSEERLKAIRESVRAAAQHQEKQANVDMALARHRTGAIEEQRALFRARYVAIAGVALLAALLALWLWPAPKAQRVLAAYLQSCDERAVQPDKSLAIGDLGLIVRNFDGLRPLPAVSYDYTAELKAAVEAKGEPSWDDVLALPEMPASKGRALKLAVPALPDEATPKALGTLAITVRPVECYLSWRRRGAASFFDGQYRFLVLKVSSPRWSCGWRVAGYERAGPPGT